MATQGCQVALTKPLHDRSGYYLGQEAGDAVVKPDFEGTIHAAGGGFLRSFAVEVMGYDRPEYRATKARVEAAITGKRVHLLEHLAHDLAGMEEHDRAFQSSLAQFGRRAISKARDMPARLAPPVVSGPAPAATPGTPNRPDRSLAVPRALTQAPSSPMPESYLTSLPGQLPGPAPTVPPPAALLPGPAYPRTGAGSATPSSQRHDAGLAASPGPRRPWFPQRLLDRLRLRR